MKHLRKFNEDLDTFSGVEDFGVENEVDMDMDTEMNMDSEMEDGFTTSIFNDIEGDMDNMSEDEKEDYLKSIISFCNQKLSDTSDMDDDMEMMDDLEEVEEPEMLEESFGRIKKFK